MPAGLRKRVLAGMVVASLVMAFVAIAVWLGTSRFLDSFDWVDHTNAVLRALERDHAAIREVEASQRGYLVTGQVDYEQEFYAATRLARDALADTRKLVADNAEQSERVHRLAELTEQRMQIAMATAQAFRSDGYDAARKLVVAGKGRDLMTRIAALHAETVEAEEALMATRQARAVADATRLRLLTLLGLASSIGILALVGRRMLVETRSRARAEAHTQEANLALHEKVDELHLRASQTREMSRYAGMLQSCRNTAEAIAVTRDACQRLLPDLGGAVYLVRASQDLVEGIGVWGAHVVPSASLLSPQECWALRRGAHLRGAKGATASSARPMSAMPGRRVQARCQSNRRLFAGIATSATNAKPAARASASTAATSRRPMCGARDFSNASKSALLSLVWWPSTSNGP